MLFGGKKNGKLTRKGVDAIATVSDKSETKRGNLTHVEPRRKTLFIRKFTRNTPTDL